MADNKKKLPELLNRQNKKSFSDAETKIKSFNNEKKTFYEFSKKKQRLKKKHYLRRTVNENLRKEIRKLKLQSSYVLDLTKKLRHENSKLKKSESNKSQLKKLKLYKQIHKKLLFLRKYYKVKLKKSIQNKRDLDLKKKKYTVKQLKKYKSKNFKKQKNRKKKIKKYGILKVLTIRRNVFITLSDLKGNVRATVSSGLLKVKGKKRQALHIVTATGQRIIKSIFKHRILKLFVFFRGRAYRKKKKTITHVFSRVKKFKFLKINRPARRCHNGCRSPKKRRK